jgi:FkbM family methyltransferase
VPELYKSLVSATRKFANVQCLPFALAEVSGRRDFFISSGASDGSSSLLRPREHLTFHPDVKFKRSIEVEAITLDEWAARSGIKRVDLLWLDLQGSEPAVLRGCPTILRTVSAIHTEVSLEKCYESAELYSDLRPWLEAQGFRVVQEMLPYPDMGNVLFARSR